MAVKRLPRDSQFRAQRRNVRFGHTHRGLGQAKFGACHLEMPPAMPPPGASRCKPGLGALDDHFAFEFRQSCEEAEHQAAG